MDAEDALRHLSSKRLAFVISPGRSGTALLTALSGAIAGVKAVHEASPRMNFVLRAVCSHRKAAEFWLKTEMFPSISQSLSIEDRVYFETSHMFCKGFIEPTIQMGLRPLFVILTRCSKDVAASLFSIGCVPERTDDGRLVLLGPTDPGVTPMHGWQSMSDYQLCYWYALEIARRQDFYESWLPGYGCEVTRISYQELADPQKILSLAKFLTGSPSVEVNLERVDAVLSQNQNPRSGLARTLRQLPPCDVRKKQEEQVAEYFR